jgi:hypothetical protein
MYLNLSKSSVIGTPAQDTLFMTQLDLFLFPYFVTNLLDHKCESTAFITYHYINCYQKMKNLKLKFRFNYQELDSKSKLEVDLSVMALISVVIRAYLRYLLS